MTTAKSPWPECPLRDLVEEVKGSVTPEPGVTYVHYSVPSFADGEPTVEDGAGIKSAKRPVGAGDVLICKINPRINRVWEVSHHQGSNVIASTEWVTVRVKPEVELDRQFLLWYLRSPRFRSLITGSVSGVTGSHTRAKPKEVLGYPVPLPPLADQRATVDRIERVLTLVDRGESSTLRAKARLALLPEIGAEAVARGRIEVAIEECATAHHAVAACSASRDSASRIETDAPSEVDLPEGWVWTTLDQIAEVQAGAAKSRKLEGKSGYIERPYLSVANVQRGALDLSKVQTMWVAESRIDALTLRPGDVLVNEGGDKDKLGRGWIWEGQIEGCIHQNHVFRVRLAHHSIDPRWVALWSNTFGRWWFHSRASQTTGIASINKTVLRSLPVAIPPPGAQEELLKEHARILSTSGRLEETVEQLLQRTRALKRSVLRAGFQGQLLEPSEAWVPTVGAEEAFV